MSWQLLLSVVLLLANAIFVGYEFAILVAKKSDFEAAAAEGNRGAQLALKAFSEVSLQLAGAQLGITMASLGLGSVAEPAIGHAIEDWLHLRLSESLSRVLGFAIALTIVTFFHLVLGEMVPKNIAIAKPGPTLRALVYVYSVFLWLFSPVVKFLNALANVGCRMLGVEPRDELVAAHSVAELSSIVLRSQQHGALERDDASLLAGALSFAQQPVSGIARPWKDVPIVRMGATGNQARRLVRDSGTSRILVQGPGAAGRTQGYVHAKDLLRLGPQQLAQPISSSLIRSTLAVRGDRPLIEVLRLMRSAKQQLAVVVSEGRPVGAASIEEVVEALVPVPVASDGAVTDSEHSDTSDLPGT
ncbi:MAG: HlyC/CorC family transporter [Acidimicrobiales bacterium]|nr:HlyC/CorC family transporter [Acidimicrobiales bacterium]